MLSKVKKFLKNNKLLIKVGIIIIILIAIFIILYKSLFYSDSEKSVYGIRLRDISDYKISKSLIKDYEKSSKEFDGITDVNIEIKGRLIKFFVTINEDKNNNDIKDRLNKMLGLLSEDIKGYYDVTFYVKQIKDGKETYPIIGYKHKSNPTMTFDEL